MLAAPSRRDPSAGAPRRRRPEPPAAAVPRSQGGHLFPRARRGAGPAVRRVANRRGPGARALPAAGGAEPLLPPPFGRGGRRPARAPLPAERRRRALRAAILLAGGSARTPSLGERTGSARVCGSVRLAPEERR